MARAPSRSDAVGALASPTGSVLAFMRRREEITTCDQMRGGRVSCPSARISDAASAVGRIGVSASAAPSVTPITASSPAAATTTACSPTPSGVNQP